MAEVVQAAEVRSRQRWQPPQLLRSIPWGWQHGFHSVNFSPQVILVVIPTPFVASTISPLADLLQPHQILVSCTKGILNDSLETPNQVLLRSTI